MKSFTAIAALVAAAFTGSVVADEYVRCATGEAPPELRQPIAIDNELMGRIADPSIAAVSIDTYVHVVTTSAKRGQYTQAQVNNQISVMNSAYSAAGFSFRLLGTDFTVNDAWAAAGQSSSAERAMKTALRKGTYSTLNLYFLSDLGGGLLGSCYFPVASPTSSDQLLNGCINLAASLPGSTATNYNLGLTAVHEVGHWFGAYHVFQGGCTGQGDLVSDTPPQVTATSGCPTRQDSCPNSAGLDSIDNYMDYSYDACMTRFTAGQISRMNSIFNQYRAGK